MVRKQGRGAMAEGIGMVPNTSTTHSIKTIKIPNTTAVVFEGPVSRLEKDRDQTGPRPIKTGNSQDRSGP